MNKSLCVLLVGSFYFSSAFAAVDYNVPNATVAADLDAGVNGQWFFNSRIFYHQNPRMPRERQYDTLIEVIKGRARLTAAYQNDQRLNFIDIEGLLPVTNNFSVRIGVHSLVASKKPAHKGGYNGMNQLSFMICPDYSVRSDLNMFAEYQYQQGYSAFRNLQSSIDLQGDQNRLSFGLTLLL